MLLMLFPSYSNMQIYQYDAIQTCDRTHLGHHRSTNSYRFFLKMSNLLLYYIVTIHIYYTRCIPIVGRTVFSLRKKFSQTWEAPPLPGLQVNAQPGLVNALRTTTNFLSTATASVFTTSTYFTRLFLNRDLHAKCHFLISWTAFPLQSARILSWKWSLYCYLCFFLRWTNGLAHCYPVAVARAKQNRER